MEREKHERILYERDNMVDAEGLEVSSLAYHRMLNKLKELYLMIIMVTSFQKKWEFKRSVSQINTRETQCQVVSPTNNKSHILYLFHSPPMAFVFVI